MPLPVDLQAVINEMDVLSNEMTAYINRKTGELYTVTDEEAGLLEAGEDEAWLPDRQVEAVAEAREVIGSDDFIALPDRFEIHEYAIMERFCLGIADERLCNALLDAIRGRGAFRRFKDLAHREGIIDKWYEYRGAAFSEIAAEFLEAHGIPFRKSG